MANPTILLADNDRDFLATRREFLEQAGYTVTTASDIEAARRLLEQSSVSLAILDVRLLNDDDEKDVSGLTLAKDAAYHSIPKIILTGFPSTDTVREALRPESGAPPVVDYVVKQAGPQAMLDSISRVLPISRRQWQPFLVASILLLGAVLAGVMGIAYGDPRWLIGTAALGILFAIYTWQLAIQ